MLSCLDGYMNIAMEKTEEHVNGVVVNRYGDAFIRGNNGTFIRPRFAGRSLWAFADAFHLLSGTDDLRVQYYTYQQTKPCKSMNKNEIPSMKHPPRLLHAHVRATSPLSLLCMIHERNSAPLAHLNFLKMTLTDSPPTQELSFKKWTLICPRQCRVPDRLVLLRFGNCAKAVHRWMARSLAQYA